MWSDKLGTAINAASVDPYQMEFHRDTEMHRSMERAIAQGIDSHLKAIFFEQSRGEHGRIKLTIEPASVSVLVRRLLESGDDEDILLASDICGTLNIELI